MEACGILIDLSEPIENSPPKPIQSKSPSQLETKNKSPESETVRKSGGSHNSLVDSIEIERSADRRGSYTIDRGNLLQDLDDITSEIDCSSDKVKHVTPEFQLLENEQFDFDLPYSPGVRSITSPGPEEEDDEEVFLGPVGFTEKCVATVVSEIAPLEEPLKPFSPLKPHQIAEIYKEAQMVVYRINKEKPDEEERGGKSKLGVPNGDAHTPLRHQRKDTFTESPEAIFRLPENVVKAMPVIDLEIEDPFQKKIGEDKENLKVEDVNRLAPPKNNKLSESKLSCSNNAKKTGSSKNYDGPASDTDDTCSVTSDTSENSVSRLPVNKCSLPKTKTSTKQSNLKRPSMLKPPGAASKSNENLSTSINSTTKTATASLEKSKIVPPSKSRRSLNPSSRKSLGLNTSGIPNNTTSSSISNMKENSKDVDGPVKKGPTTRLSLMKPGGIQKPALKSQITETKSKTGPLKALPNTSNIPDKVEEKVKPALSKQMLLDPSVCTPVKPEKRVQPKLLSSNFTTPIRSNSVSSSTPASVRRKSFLPTPQKVRSESTSALPQPSPLVKSSSTSSQKMSLSESPLVSRSLKFQKVGTPLRGKPVL
ncbi:G2 and S phase-expressed protein 1-like isoform X1 [Saccostrea echinata]|uniref:G2 and S phase-expressed protein 1-like isoform X1 n=1 Tax=Saccostrea echinata TaxID=191078 RepID=UPI002A83D548|nr:G2 and S phase-expressed protein 1-like isoform X1 [Saccostrea echinata]